MKIAVGAYYYAPSPLGPILVQVLSITDDDKVIIRMENNGSWFRCEPIFMSQTRVWEPAQAPEDGGTAA